MEKSTSVIEIWTPITGYEDRYLVSNFGNIYSLAFHKNVRPRKDCKGYMRVNLYNENGHKTIRVHRLVATHFLRSVDGKTEINHINEDKTDNRVENLEYCTRSYNVNYGMRIEKQRKKVSKPVLQFNLQGDCLKRYDSITQAATVLKMNISGIRECCHGNRKTAGGYKWRFCEKQ